MGCDPSDLLPENMSGTKTFSYGTGYYGLVDRAGIQKGETLLVLGAGGNLGLAAVELGKALGARVIAAASGAARHTVMHSNWSTPESWPLTFCCSEVG